MCRLYAESTLPNELWLMVFQQINDTKCLAQCRLVCKLFDSLAEKALFRQNLDLTTVDKIKKFLYHLNSKPKIARYINFIHLSDVAPLHLQRRLLNQALTPNIKSLTGEMRENVFDHFLNILQRSPDKFSQLQVLPNFPNLCRKRNPGGIFVPTCNYGQVLLYFKESLKQLTIQVQPSDLPQISESVIFRLNEFQNLTFLDLDFQIYNRLDDLNSYLGLDYILSNCTMNLEILYLHWRAKLTFMEKEDFKTWLQRNDVEQAPNLGELKITGVSSPHILEYLLYKYPNVSKLAIHNLDDFSDRIVKEIQNMDSLFLAINDIPHPQRRQDMNRIEQFTDLIQSTQSTVNSLLISKRHSNSLKKEMFYIEKSISTRSTVYGVTTNRYETSVHKELISLIGPVSSLRVLYDNHVDQQRLGEELNSLCKMIPFNNLNSLTHLELTGDRI
ncbi:hypothetical protein [Parasitella parasitica]|uniref:F-box domain-containing protein n=1 Tax=Parasitella parasitica TaxID=35722 RepID=A0A0B7NM59_9FUNG|nr:hypothetical protein [Parasitella parasitica]